MVKVLFNNKCFNTKGTFKLYIKNIIYNHIGITSSIKDNYNNYFDEMIELFKRHPNYINKTKNLIDIEIIQNIQNRNAYGMNIINNDKTITPISWITCIKGVKTSNKQNLTNAFRSSISNQIMDFKKDKILECEFCNNTTDIHVDHILHFHKIRDTFLKTINHDLQIPTQFTSNNYNNTVFLEKDSEFNNLWQHFHQQNAELRLLCRSCNLLREN